MTIINTLRLIRAMGLTAVYLTEWKEYRINYRSSDPRYHDSGNGIDTSYHTTDATDALATARTMTRQPAPTAPPQ